MKDGLFFGLQRATAKAVLVSDIRFFCGLALSQR